MNKLQTKNAFGVFVLLVAFLAHNSPLARNIAKKQHIADSVRNLYRVAIYHISRVQHISRLRSKHFLSLSFCKQKQLPHQREPLLSFRVFVLVIFYSPETRETNTTMHSIISLQSNRTRCKANKTTASTLLCL